METSIVRKEIISLFALISIVQETKFSAAVPEEVFICHFILQVAFFQEKVLHPR